MNHHITYVNIYLGIVFLFVTSACHHGGLVQPEGFEIEDGFQLQLVAQEPLLADPVDIEFDEHGRAFVLEMPGYPYEDRESSIVRLIDQDGDGIYDDSSVYADELELASSLMPYKRGFLVAAPPYLLHVMDTDGDLVADRRDTLMGGFSTGNLQHNYNGLTYGLDNWIYAANGGNSGKPYWWDAPDEVLDLLGDDFRIDIDNKIIERIGPSSGGFELGIDEWGHIMGTHNLEHINQIVWPRTYANPPGQDANHTLVNISDHEENGLSRIYPIGEQETRVNHPEQSGYFSGACGITYYGGGTLGDDYNRTVWIADVVLNLIHIDVLYNTGARLSAGRKLEGKDFLASTDRSFRPVNLTVGPDGSMYIVDMYRDVIEHPEWIPDEIEKTLDLDAGKDKGRIYKVSTSSEVIAVDDVLENLTSVDGRVELLKHDNQWVRNTAHRLILEEGKSGDNYTSLLQRALKSTSDLQRLHSFWILKERNELETKDLIAQLGHDNSNYVKHVLVVAEELMISDDLLLSKVIEFLKNGDEIVAMQAALLLSNAPESIRSKHKKDMSLALLEAIQGDVDEWTRYALILASKELEVDLFRELANMKEPDTATLELLALSVAGKKEKQIELVGLLGDIELSDVAKATIIESLYESFDKSYISSSLLVRIGQLEKSDDPNLLATLQKLRQKLDLDISPKFMTFIDRAVTSLRDKNVDVAQKIVWMDVLSLMSFRDKKDLLDELIKHDQPIKIQTLALEQLWEADNPAVGELLVDGWSSLAPQARRTASDILLYKEAHHDALLTGLENEDINIGEMNFDLERRRTLLWWTDNQDTKDRAEALFSDAGVVTRSEVMDTMKAALSLQGNVEHGAEVFDQLCGQCHIYGDRGYDVGPALTEIRRKSKESLLHDILDPNASLDTRYVNHKITLSDGQIHLGIISAEDDDNITIKKMAGVSVDIKKSDIESFTSLGTSFMMEGLEANLDHQKMADLLSYLQNG